MRSSLLFFTLYYLIQRVQIKDTQSFVNACDKCQITGNISNKNEMSLNLIMEVELFDVGDIDFISPFLSSRGNKYIPLALKLECLYFKTFRV